MTGNERIALASPLKGNDENIGLSLHEPDDHTFLKQKL
jgi:hypothetical protein